jgi:hypothetical protein
MEANISVKTLINETLINAMIKRNPNDYDLGLNFRKRKNILSDSVGDELFKKYPNDYDLGKQVRGIYK